MRRSLSTTPRPGAGTPRPSERKDVKTQTPLTPPDAGKVERARGRSSISEDQVLRRSGRLSSRSRSRGRESSSRMGTPGRNRGVDERADYPGSGGTSPNIIAEEDEVPAKRMKQMILEERSSSSPNNKSIQQITTSQQVWWKLRMNLNWVPSLSKLKSLVPSKPSVPNVDPTFLPEACQRAIKQHQEAAKNNGSGQVKATGKRGKPSGTTKASGGSEEEDKKNLRLWRKKVLQIVLLYVFLILPLRAYVLEDWPRPPQSGPQLGSKAPFHPFGGPSISGAQCCPCPRLTPDYVAEIEPSLRFYISGLFGLLSSKATSLAGVIFQYMNWNPWVRVLRLLY